MHECTPCAITCASAGFELGSRSSGTNAPRFTHPETSAVSTRIALETIYYQACKMAPSDACVQCGQPGILFCEHADVDGQISITAYCSKSCQSADWLAHKTGCLIGRQRFQLYRGGQLFQDIFYIVREEMFDTFIHRVDKDANGKLHVFEAPPEDDAVLAPLVELPAETFDDRDKKALLSRLACSDSQVLLERLVEKAFGGTALRPQHRARGNVQRLLIQEYRHVQSHRRARRTHEEITRATRGSQGLRSPGRKGNHGHPYIDTFDYPHAVTCLKLKGNDLYVLDIAGAQYGQYRAVVPHSNYSRAFVRGPVPMKQEPELGSLHRSMARGPWAGTFATPENDRRVTWVMLPVKRELDRVVEEWESQNALSLAKLLTLPIPAFRQKQTEMLHFVREGVKAYIERSKEDGTFSFELVSGKGTTAVWRLKEL